MSAPLVINHEAKESLLHLRLDRPRANIIDAKMITALRAALSAARDDRHLKAVLLSAAGPHFSFGASVSEHMPDRCADMLADMHRLIGAMLEFPLPILVAVQGQCLGGGLEVAMAGSLIFAATDARFGQPEISLGVFAPAASLLLPALIGPMAAVDMLLSGRSIDAAEAEKHGLARAVGDDPLALARNWFDDHLAAKSAASLRCATRALREPLAARFSAGIGPVEKLYLDDLMKTRDAVEGLEAFVEKRPAKWEDC